MSSRKDSTDVRKAFSKAYKSYDSAAVLQREVSNRLLERLSEIKHSPKRILDLGAGTGNGTQALKQIYRKADVYAVDFALPMLQQLQKRSGFFRKLFPVCADIHALPFVDQHFDLLFSSLTLQWCQNLQLAFSEARRVMAQDGMYLFATLGADTLRELRSAWQAVDQSRHVNMFFDMHDIGDALLQSGFKDPVVDVERITLTYPDVRSLLYELKALGANTLLADNHTRGLMGKGRFERMLQAYDEFRTDDGRYPATFEVVFGLAWQFDVKTKTDDMPLTFVSPSNMPK